MKWSGVAGPLLCCVPHFGRSHVTINFITVMEKNNKNGCGCGSTSKGSEKTKTTTTASAKKPEMHDKQKK